MHGTGWLRELPDLRDFDAMDIVMEVDPGSLCKAAPPKNGINTALAAKVDVRKHCSHIENQGRLGSCVAQAIVGMAEYMERRTYGRHIDASRLFVYKMARQLDGFRGDTGAYIRTGMKGLRLFGAPAERYWPYDVSKFDEDPSGFVFALGQNFQALSYYRLDQGARSREDVLRLLKCFVSTERPVVFGFRVYSFGNEKGEFPMPAAGQRPYGGHAVMAVGYDDEYVIGKSKGAILIRNSWGTGWGQKGYGWLPYDYVIQRLSADFWTLFYKEMVMD